MKTPTSKEAIIMAEKAIGENLVWLSDKLDIDIRQDNKDVIRRLEQLNQAWIALCKVKVML